MSLKSHVLANPNSCLNKAAADEPIFVLRAKDPEAPTLIRAWAQAAQLRKVAPTVAQTHHQFHDDAKINNALTIADKMDRWREAYLRDQAELVDGIHAKGG